MALAGRRGSAPPVIAPRFRSALMAETPPTPIEMSRSQSTSCPSAARRSPAARSIRLSRASRAGISRMGLERVGLAVRAKTGRVDCGLDVHPEHHVIEQDLEHALRLGVASRRPEGHDEFTPLQRDCRIGGQTRSLAGRDAARVPGNGERLRASGGRREPEARHHRGVPARVARRRREDIAAAVDDRGVGGVRCMNRRRCVPRSGGCCPAVRAAVHGARGR